MKKLLLGMALALLVPAVAHAQESGSSSEPEGRRSVGFSSSKGLTGMRDLIDARVPTTINIRGMLRFDNESTNLDSPFLAHSLDVYSADFIAGASALGILDAGLRLPVEIRVEKDDVHGGPSRKVTVNGVGDAEVSGKVGFQLGPWIALGPYATLHWNTGSGSLEKTNEMHLGGCGTVSFLDDRIAGHVNITSISYDGGKWAFGYRLGVSIVPIAIDGFLLRLFLYVDGKDYIGTRVHGNDGRIFGGAQVLLFKIVTAEFSMGWKFDRGDLPGYIADIGTYGLDLGAGVSFMF